MNEYWMEGDHADIIYMNISKVFDTVSYFRLLLKMKT